MEKYNNEVNHAANNRIEEDNISDDNLPTHEFMADIPHELQPYLEENFSIEQHYNDFNRRLAAIINEVKNANDPTIEAIITSKPVVVMVTEVKISSKVK